METPISPEQKKEIDKLFDEVMSSKKENTSFKDNLKDIKEISDRIRKDYDDQSRVQKEQTILTKITNDFSNQLHELVNINFPKTLFTEAEMKKIFDSKDKDALEYLTHKIATIEGSYLYQMELELQKVLDIIKFRERVNGLYCQKILKLDFEELSKLLTDKNYEDNFIKQLEQQQKEFDIHKEQF